MYFKFFLYFLNIILHTQTFVILFYIFIFKNVLQLKIFKFLCNFFIKSSSSKELILLMIIIYIISVYLNIFKKIKYNIAVYPKLINAPLGLISPSSK